MLTTLGLYWSLALQFEDKRGESFLAVPLIAWSSVFIWPGLTVGSVSIALFFGIASFLTLVLSLPEKRFWVVSLFSLSAIILYLNLCSVDIMSNVFLGLILLESLIRERFFPKSSVSRSTAVKEDDETVQMEISWRGFPQLCLLYTSPSPRDQRGSRMPSSA